MTFHNETSKYPGFHRWLIISNKNTSFANYQAIYFDLFIPSS